MKRSYTLFFIMLALTSGCTTTAGLSEQMADWQGSSVGSVYAAWGEPETSETFGSETVLIWRDRTHQLTPGGAPVRWDASAVICERMIAVDAGGDVTGWRWRGDDCPSLHITSGSPNLVASQ